MNHPQQQNKDSTWSEAKPTAPQVEPNSGIVQEIKPRENEEMKQIAVCVPTYKRPNQLEKLIKNFHENSTKASLYFVISPEDTDTSDKLTELSVDYNFTVFECAERFAQSTNYVYRHTKEPFFMAGADDILFTKGWDSAFIKAFDDPNIYMTGGIDDWAVSKTGLHTSHPCFRRSYVDEVGSSWGEPVGKYDPDNLDYNNKLDDSPGFGCYGAPPYQHYQVDIECEQLAWSRGGIKVLKDVTIHHNSFVNKKAPKDATYLRGAQVSKQDTDRFLSRLPNFHYFDMDGFHQGKAKLMSNHKQKLSIIMPIWNCAEITEQTLDSLCKNTFNKWELILLDDASTEFDGEKFLMKLRDKAYAGGFTTVKTYSSKEQKMTNSMWNKGVELSSGSYIAIVNNDLTFQTEDWDDILLENVELGYELISPFRADRTKKAPYQHTSLPCPTAHLRLYGACFLILRSMAERVFPLNTKRYVHWCGDNVISAKANTWIFDSRVCVYHHLSKSSAKVDRIKFHKITQSDIKNYMEDFKDPSLRTLLR